MDWQGKNELQSISLYDIINIISFNPTLIRSSEENLLDSRSLFLWSTLVPLSRIRTNLHFILAYFHYESDGL